jgi:hypothetical protein
MGLKVAQPAAAQVGRELKGFGRALDPAPLAALATELATAWAAVAASSNELARLTTLAGQGNASTRALQTAEATAQRDQLAVQSARDRLALSWSRAIADRTDLPALVQSLVSLETTLVRVDLPVGEVLARPAGARLTTPAGEAGEVEFLGPASGVDPQMQGQGFLLRTLPKSPRLLPGQAVVGYLKVPGEPLAGVIVPRDAVVRAEGAGWVYVRGEKDAESFTRTEIVLDRPVESGWFVTRAVAATDYLVVNGAQQLLSTELKGGGGD